MTVSPLNLSVLVPHPIVVVLYPIETDSGIHRKPILRSSLTALSLHLNRLTPLYKMIATLLRSGFSTDWNITALQQLLWCVWKGVQIDSEEMNL